MAKTVPPGVPPAPATPTNLPATGTFTPPPPGAPIEVSQPLKPELIQEMRDKANQNERELAPLKFALGKAVAAAAGAPGVPISLPPDVVTAPPHAAPNAPAGSEGKEGVPDAAPPSLAPGPVHPAASDTDTPSRGIPKPIADPGKQITGGWGEGGGFEPQYYALDGTELAQVIRTIWKDIEERLQYDLRFGIACCYPQVAAKVTLEITGATASAQVNDIAFTIESRVLKLEGVKVDDNTTPADALRVEAGLARPFKHTVVTATGTLIVDRDSDLGKGTGT